MRENVKAFDEKVDGTVVDNELVSAFWDNPDNNDVIDAFMNNEFIWFAAQNSSDEVLKFYQQYALQDYFSLIDSIRFRALRLTTVLDKDWEDFEAEADSIAENIKWTKYWRGVMTEHLDLKAEYIDMADRSGEELAYSRVLQERTNIDDWFDLQVITIPRLFGYHKLAESIEANPHIRRDTTFYKTWVQSNLDPKYALQLLALTNAHRDKWATEVNKGANSEKLRKWNTIFRTAMRLETGLFKSSGK